MKYTEKEIAEYLRKGTDVCIICGSELLGREKTRCSRCGAPRQILVCLVPLLKDYWNETKARIPLDIHLLNSPILKEEDERFMRWLKDNNEKYRKDYEEEFDWDEIMRN